MLKEYFLRDLKKAILYKNSYFILKRQIFGLPNDEIVIINNPSEEHYIYYNLLLDDNCKFINNPLNAIIMYNYGNDILTIIKKFSLDKSELNYSILEEFNRENKVNTQTYYRVTLNNNNEYEIYQSNLTDDNVAALQSVGSPCFKSEDNAKEYIQKLKSEQAKLQATIQVYRDEKHKEDLINE